MMVNGEDIKFGLVKGGERIEVLIGKSMKD